MLISSETINDGRKRVTLYLDRKLTIYPNGDTDEEGTFSVSFSIADTDSLPAGWEVNAIFAFFIHNQMKDNYVCFRGSYFSQVLFSFMKYINIGETVFAVS